jgi:hypothetical protein
MPPREAKGRYLTREYMADAAFHRTHDAAERELYMMLALFTDDSGWLEWDPDYLMFSVYRYEDGRSSTFNNGVTSLQASGRLKVYRCGHALMPKVGNRPRSGEHEYRVRDEHQARCQSKGSRSKTTSSRPRTTRPPNPTVPNLNLDQTGALARETSDRLGAAQNGGPSFKDQAVAAGLDPSKIGHGDPK